MTTYVWAGADREHRVVMERHLGRKLRRDEHVHHRNGDKTDNRLVNLEVLPARQHHQLHRVRTSTDREIADSLLLGWRVNDFTAVGISGHRVVRVRRELRDAGHGALLDLHARFHPQRVKAVCKHGHARDGDNLRVYVRGGKRFRLCVACNRAKALRHRERSRRKP